MEGPYIIEYADKVVKLDLPALPKPWRLAVKRSLEDKLAKRPEIYGQPLHGTLSGYRKFRIGNYRAIFKIKNGVIKIFIIDLRSRVYETALRRLGLK